MWPTQWTARFLEGIVLAGLLSVAQAGAGQTVATSPSPTPQTSSQKPPDQPAPTSEEEVKEVGGRLVITATTVVVAADPDRLTRDASIATKMDAPLLETPRSVTLIERRTLDERQAVKLADAHDYAVGVMTADERAPAYARGFPISFYDVRRDGLRTFASSLRETVALEQVQYLRGPASILYGDGSPGGLVNLVLRRPLPVARQELTASLGQGAFRRFTGDVTGPLTSGHGVRYRLIGSGEWADNGFGNDERRVSVVPMLSFDLGERATLHIDSELFQHQGRAVRHAVPVTPDTQRGNFSRVPWDLNPVSPGSGWSGWSVSPSARLDLAFSATTSLHTAARYTRIHSDFDLETVSGYDQARNAINRTQYLEHSTWHELQSDTFILAAARTGSIAHRLVFGAEAGLSTADSLIGTGAAPALNMDNPVYLPRISTPALLPTRYDVSRFGLYVQDQMRLRPAISLVPGFRVGRIGVHDRVDRSAIPGVEQTSSDVKASPSLGVVVMPASWLSLYASGARGFEPPTPGQYRDDGLALANADSASIEGGVKADALGGQFSFTSAVFGIRRTNVPEADGRGFFRQIGEGRSRGVELEVVGSVADGLFLQGGYAWTRTAITENDAGNRGRELPNAPHHIANLLL